MRPCIVKMLEIHRKMEWTFADLNHVKCANRCVKEQRVDGCAFIDTSS